MSGRVLFGGEQAAVDARNPTGRPHGAIVSARDAALLLPPKKEHSRQGRARALLRASSIGADASDPPLGPPGDSAVDGIRKREVDRDRRSATSSSGRP